MRTVTAVTTQVIIGDSRNVLEILAGDEKEEKARLVYVDPPFNTRERRGPFRDHRTTREWSKLVAAVVAKSAALLRSDGSLWLHLNDRQVGLARNICDEVFGEQNYCGTIIWEHTRSPSYLHRQLSSTTDFIVVYAKEIATLPAFTFAYTESNKRIPIAHRGNRQVELLFPKRRVLFNCPDGCYEPGDHSTPGIEATLLDPVEVRGGRNVAEFRIRLPSRYSPLRFSQLLAEGADFVIPKAPFRPSYISPGGVPKLIRNLWTWQMDEGIPTNEDAYKEQGAQFATPFAYAKPTGLMRRIIEVATDPGDLVLDPFGGSGTTAVAAVETGRSCVLIEEQEALVHDYINPRIRVAASRMVSAL